MSHPLQHKWAIFLHYPSHFTTYAQEASEEACSFDTVEDFWRYFEYIPLCSKVFTHIEADTVIHPRIDGRVLEGYGLFKDGIRPEWEDPINAKGGHWEMKMAYDLDILDETWRCVVLGLIGETVGEHITGARMVDKSKTKRPEPEYRLEIWTDTCDEADINAIRDRICEYLQKYAYGEREVPSLVFKQHETSLKTAATMSNKIK